MNHDQDCPCATDSVPHGAGCADCSCVKNICPTCEGDVKGEIVDGKCRACQLGVIPDWMKPKGTEKRYCEERSPSFIKSGTLTCNQEAGHAGLHTGFSDGMPCSWRAEIEL